MNDIIKVKTRFKEKDFNSIEEALNEYRFLCSQYEDVRMEQFVIFGESIYTIKYRYERN